MTRTVLTLALVLSLPALANASQIAVGLDFRQNVFVQEYWQHGKACYAIFNSRPEAIKLTLNDVQFVNRPGTESFQAIEGKELGSWQVKSKEVVFVDAPPTPADNELRFVQFRIAGRPALGVLTYPLAPADLPKGKIVSSDGMNGSGGRQPWVCYEHDSLTFKSEGVIEVKLKMPAGGTVTFKKTKSMDAPAEALISGAECDTLPVQVTKEGITIDANKPLKAAAIHTITLRFTAPKVDGPTMVEIDGWVAVSGGGYHVIRGVIVQPEK